MFKISSFFEIKNSESLVQLQKYTFFLTAIKNLNETQNGPTIFQNTIKSCHKWGQWPRHFLAKKELNKNEKRIIIYIAIGT